MLGTSSKCTLGLWHEVRPLLPSDWSKGNISRLSLVEPGGLALAKKEPPDKMQGGASKVQPDGWSLWDEKVQWPIERSTNIFRNMLVALHSTQLSPWVNLSFELA